MSRSGQTWGCHGTFRNPEGPRPDERFLATGIRRVGVLGAGTMGHGIAEAAALAGFEVTIYDVQQRFLDGGMEKIRWSVSKLREKGALTQSRSEEVLRNIRTTLDMHDLADADLVIEAVPEELPLKAAVFRELERHNLRAIMASNTSTIPITEISRATSRPAKFVGMHFFNPPVLMPLVEVVRGDMTDQGTVDDAVAFAGALGKRVVLCNRDVPGFVVNRVLGPLLNEAAWCVARGQVTVEQADSAAVFKVGLPMGLFELADYTGIDIVYRAGEAVRGREPSAIPVAPLFKEKFEQGKFGAKSGEGFYTYRSPGSRPSRSREAGQGVDPLLFFSVAVNAAAWLLRNEVCSREDLDLSVKLGLGFPDGLLRMADRWGIDRIVEVLKEKERLYGSQYAPDPLLVQMVREGAAGASAGRGFYEYATAERKFEEVSLRKVGSVAWISLNRPHRLNTVTPRMTDELEAATRDVASDRTTRVVVITGEGDRAFSAGADLTSFGFVSQAKAFDASRRMYEVFTLFETMPKPVVAAINGFAFGGGCELALACDFRLASETSQIGLTETSLGIVPGAGGTQRLPRLVGLARAREMIYFGSKLTAKEALSAGLVDRVFPKAEFRAGVEEFANRLAKRAPLSLRVAKEALNLATRSPPDREQYLEAEGFAALLSTQDASEGIASFLSKTEPEFKGE
jgi:enoyl-CoA hydratase/3-hydroxyacyl-CoA dehydrogenase